MKYATNGFNPAVALCHNDIAYFPQAAVAITKGQYIHDNGSGYATNTDTAFANTFLGIALVDSDNSAGAAGDVNIAVIRPLPHISFWVKNESGTVAAQTDVGEQVDLESNDGIDVTDTTIASNAGWAFLIEKIDITSAATSANAGGFVKGRFVPNPTT